MPVELSISAIPEMSTLIYFRNDNPDVLVELAEAWIDENLAGRLPPLCAGESTEARVNEQLSSAWISAVTPNRLN